MSNKAIKYLLIGLLGAALLVGNIIISAQSNKRLGAVVPSVGGICNGSEAGVQMCNVSIRNLSVNDAFDVTGAFTAYATTTLSGNTLAANLTQTGTVTTYTGTSTTIALSAADVCNSTLYLITPPGATPTVTLPATTTLFASCLSTLGNFHDLSVMTVGTSTILAAGSGGTLGYSSTSTLAAGKYGTLRVIRDTATTYKAFLNNILN